MLNALYYPHTDIQSPAILKNALLLWDSIETIVPHANWHRTEHKENIRKHQRRANNANEELRQATELIVKARVPSQAERKAAHTTLSEIVKSGLATELILQSPRNWRRPEYLIYPQKFLAKTWHLLESGGMAHWQDAANDYGVPAALGFLMMSTLADSCAGTQMQKVTDRADAYSWLERHRASMLGSPYVTGLDVSQVAPNLDRLVTITCEVLDARDIPLKKLVDFRKREIKSGSRDYSALRRRYSALLQMYLDRIGKEAKTIRDALSRPEIISQLREFDHDRLAKILEDLSYQEQNESALNRYSMYIKRLLVLMDRPAYREFVDLRRTHKRTKKTRRSNSNTSGNGRLS